MPPVGSCQAVEREDHVGAVSDEIPAASVSGLSAQRQHSSRPISSSVSGSGTTFNVQKAVVPFQVILGICGESGWLCTGIVSSLLFPAR